MEMPVCRPLLLFLDLHSLLEMQNGPCNGMMILSFSSGVPLYMGTYHSTARFIFNFRLSFCTLRSMRETTLPESAFAVVSISSKHCWPGLCIPVWQQLVWYMLIGKNTHSPNVHLVEIPWGWPEILYWKYFPSCHWGVPNHDLDPPTSSQRRAWTGHIWWILRSQELENLVWSISVHQIVFGCTIFIKANIVKMF